MPLGELDDIVKAHFGVRLEVNKDDEWGAIDSKTLRGTTSADDSALFALARLTLIMIERQTVKTAQRKTSLEISYYVSNQEVSLEHSNVQSELFTAIRRHWGVESENWIREQRQRQNQMCRPSSRYGMLTDIRGEAFPQGESQELASCA